MLVGLVMSILLVVSLGTTNNFVFAESIFYFEQGIIYGFAEPPQDDVAVVIPATINGEPVTKLMTNNIEAVAFNSEDAVNFVTSVDFSNATNLTEIGNVFYGCTYLSGTIVLPDNIKTIHRYSFLDTMIDRVVINHLDTSLNICETSFPVGTRILFQSEEIMNQYISQYDVWGNYNLTYLYNLEIEAGNTIISTIQVEKGQVLGSLYNEIVDNYLPNYDNIELYQNGDKVTENTILDGSRLILVNAVDYTYTLDFDYGEEILINPNIVSDSYTWEYNNKVVSNSNLLQLNNLNVGEYIYTFKTDDVVIVYNVVINPLKYDFSWPVKAKYEYLEMSDYTFITPEHEGKVMLEYYKFDGENYSKVNSLSIGNFKIVAKPINANYYIENNEFDIIVDYSYLTIVWENPTHHYTGENITPKFYLQGDLKGFDIKILTNDSILTAKEVGKYSINVIGLSHEYFALTQETVVKYNWEIVTTELTIDWTCNEVSYGSGNMFTINGIFEDICIPLVITDLQGNNVALNSVGTYNVKVSIPTEYEGFYINGSETGTIEVLPVKLDLAFVCDDTYYYNGEYVLIYPIITTDINDNVEIILEDNYYKNAGTYTAKVLGIDNPNYYVEEGIEFEWTILPKQLVVSWYNTLLTYNGEVRKPRAVVDTGIEGEDLAIYVDTDANINANENGSGYLATARLVVENTNYQLTNASTQYYIKRATPILTVSSEQSVVYNGKHQLPEYELEGDSEALKILINEVETLTGVKEPGSYFVQFVCEQSDNYLALAEPTNCVFIIKANILANSIGKLNVSVSHENGFSNNELNVEEITEHYIEIINEMSKMEEDLYKAFKILGVDDYNDSKIDINIDITRVNPERIQVYFMNGRTLEKVDVSVVEKGVTFKGFAGTYYVFLEDQIWFATPFGIITISLLVLAGISLFLYFTMFRSKHSESYKITKMVEEKIQAKVAWGQNVSAEDIVAMREEAVKELQKNKSTNQDEKKC